MFSLSFTISSYRKHLLPQIIKNIESQTVRPERIFIYYSQEPWHLDRGLERPPQIKTFLPVEFRSVPNIGSCRKYLFTLRESYGQEKLHMFIDDDVAWRPDVFKTLLTRLKEDNLGMVTTRGWSDYSIFYNQSGQPILRNNAVQANEIHRNKEILIANSGWCTLLNSKYLNRNLFDKKLHANFGLRYSDEIFLSAMMDTPKYVVPIKGRFYHWLDTRIYQWLNASTSKAKLKQLDLIGARN